MRSKTLFVWLAAAMAMLVTLFMPQTASAQIDVSAIIDAECIEDPNGLVPPNGIIDELGDELRIHVQAAYMSPFCDSIDVGLETQPDLGALNPALYPSIIMNCPAGLTSFLYEMNVTVTPHMGLGGPTANPFDSCLVEAELQFHPEGVVASAGDPLDFGVTWFGWATTPPQGFQQSFCADAGFQMQAPCSINSGCAFIRYIEAGGIAYDGIVAIGDSIWLDSLMMQSLDTMDVGDTVFWDASGLTCDGGDNIIFAYDTLVVQPCQVENGMGCDDIIWLYYAHFDESGDPDDFDYPGDVVDSFECVRPVDNAPPALDAFCVDSCRIINGNYMDNDTIAGCNDTLVVYLSTIQNGFPTRSDNDWNCDGDSVEFDLFMNAHYGVGEFGVDCDEASQNFDVAYLALDFEDFVMPGDTFPINSPVHNLLSDTALWVSNRFFNGSGGDPGSINDLIYLKIPISCCGDTSLWDSLEYCILEALENLDTIYAYSIDDAGNLSNEVAWGDSAGDLVGCDICLDNQHPELPGSNVYWSWDGDDNYCNQRFSPYDSALATVYTNLSPDSIRWYLDAVDSVYDTTNLVHNLTKVYLIGFDVRVIPDDNPDTPTGSIITQLDYYHPYAVPTGSDTWEWRSPYVPGIDSSACFTWYGKDGVDSLDDDLDILNVYCPWGMLVGITEARYMDRGGCNAVYGSDHDGATSITDGYTQLNCLYSVLDTCRPTTELAFDLNDWYHDPLPFGPDYGSVNDPYLWVDGNETPLLAFRAHRYYTQGLLDTCLAEDLCYRVKVDTVYIQGTWSYSADSFYVGSPFSCGSAEPVCYPISFLFNDVYSDTVQFYWEMEDPDCDPLPDGLYCLTLELIDNAGNVYNEDTVCIWKNGLGPAIDSVAVVNDALNCNLNFFVGESLCVWIATDTSATEVMFDFSCIYNMSLVQPDSDTMIVSAPYATSGALDYWYACVMVQDSMIDTADVSRNSYRINPVEGDCRDADDYYNIGVTAYDIDGNFTEAEYTDGNCVIAILGPSRCPRIVGPIEFWYYYPDTVYAGIDYTDSINALFDDFDTFGPMPDWNAFSPGSVDSSGAYDSEDNPAHDEIHDSIFVRILLDTLSITQPDNFGVPWDDDVYHDTLYVEFHNPSNTRSRIVAKPLFKTLCEDLDGSIGCEDPDSNTIYDGRLENADPDAFIDTDALMEFSYMWNGTWFITAGMDSLMLVPIEGQDTILVNAWTVDGDSIVDSVDVDEIYYFTCPQVSAELDVDNENPEFLEWTGIATGVRDEDTHSTATVQNEEWDGDCGFRFAEGDTFKLTVRASEQVHYDPAAYPNSDGSEYGAADGLWQITGNWQISLVDPATQYLIPNGSAPGDYIAVELVSVTPESLDVDEWEYTLIGRIYNMPEDTFIHNSCFVIRGAWDQGGNPGRYNTPPFSDAYEEDSFEDTTFCVDLIPCDVFAAGCPDVYGPDMIHGWIAPEDTNIVVCATLIETCEITDCVPGVHADSLRVVEGDFQRITDDPNPWILPDSVGDWFIYSDGLNELGWARMYYWTLRADSSDLATIWCDGNFLDFRIHAVSWEGVNVTQTFDECVQVDVNEPRWAECHVAREAESGTIVLDSTGAVIWTCDEDACIQPDQELTLVGNLRDYLVDCIGFGTGVDTSEIYADLSSLLNIHDGSADSVRPDSIAVLIGGGGGTYAYTGAPVAITDGDTSFASIDVPITGTVTGLTVTITDIHHTFTGDLDIFLRSPDGVMVELSTDNDGGNQYLDCIFDDDATYSITASTAPHTGTWSPEASMISALSGDQIFGTWTLVVYDDDDPDEGFINDWSITFDAFPILDVDCYWTFTPDDTFYCINSVVSDFKFLAGHDMIGHHDRELFLQDTIPFCSDCVPPYIFNAAVFCECDSVVALYLDEFNPMPQGPLNYLAPGSNVHLAVCAADTTPTTSLGMSFDMIWVDLSGIDTTLGWVQQSCALTGGTAYGDTACVVFGDHDCENLNPLCSTGSIEMNHVYNNGQTIYLTFALSDSAGNVDTVQYAVGIFDSLPPIVDFIHTIGDDSIRGYISPGDDHIHVYADINGYAADLVSAPEHVWADFSQFQCDTTSKAWYDTVYANYIEDLGGGNYRAWWGWHPGGSWVGDPFDINYLIPGDTTSLPWDTLSACESCSTWITGTEGTFDSIWVYVTDAACNWEDYYNVFEVSGCDSTTPGLDSVWVWGNHCGTPGWISSTPLDSGHIEVWAWMDTTFNAYEDTLKIDSLQASLVMLGSPRWDHTAWTVPDFFGGWPVYDTLSAPDSTRWDTMTVDGRVRLIGKWLWLTADDLGDCEEVIVPVKSIRQTGLGGSHGYYMDVEYGYAHVDTTKPVIYDMRVHSSTTSIAETTWVTPNYPLYVEYWAYDTGCNLNTDHIGFDLTHEIGGPGPWITFECGGILDSLWTWDTTAFEVTWYAGWDTLTDPAPADLELAAMADSICIRFTGMPIYDDSCNVIDLDNLQGCVEAHIEDCLSNPADPVQKTVTTDDRPPQYVNSVPWGDFTFGTEFPPNGSEGIDSVLVLQNATYNMDWDSVLYVYVIVDNAPGDTLLSWEKTYIDFSGFLRDFTGNGGPDYTLQFPDSIYYNIDGNHRDSVLWVIPLYDYKGTDAFGVIYGPIFETNIASDLYYWPLFLSDSLCNRSTFYCDDLDSAIVFTIQNWNSPNPGMLLLCDSNTVAGTDTDFVDQFNMDLWNNEKVSPDSAGSSFVTSAMENLYKIWPGGPVRDNGWFWYSHEDVNQTRFFVFVQDTVLESDGIDNDNDGQFDEVGEGIDFFSADLRINDFPQVGHVDSMLIDGSVVNYLWFADNFSEGRYNVELFISDIYGHRDTLACGDYALTFFEDETCPQGDQISFFQMYEDKPDEELDVCWNGVFTNDLDPEQFTADDSVFVGANFDSLVVALWDTFIYDDPQQGSGVDADTTTDVDSTNWNDGLASSVRLLDPNMVEVAFVQVYDTSDGYAYVGKDIMLVDPTGTALEGHPDGIYTIEVVALDNMGNSCTYTWNFTLDRTCPDIQQAFVARPGTLTPLDDLFTSWDYVEIRAIVDDALDGVEEVGFDYAFDANRDGLVDEYTLWQYGNIVVADHENAPFDDDHAYAVYWNIRNLTWNSEDTLGMPPVNADSCLNTWFVRVHAWDKFGNYCVDTLTVNITDDIAPLAFISSVDGDTTPQSALVPCFEPNVDTDSTITIRAADLVQFDYDPLPGDTFANNTWTDYGYAGLAVEILDNDTVEASILVTDEFELVDVNITIDDLDHTFVSDLIITLISPSGTEVRLWNGNAGSADDITGALFDDSAPNSINTASDSDVPFTGNWRPTDPLFAFHGETSLGTWTLRVEDTQLVDEGWINSWTLHLGQDEGTAERWFDLAKGMFQYKFFEAPYTYTPGNTDPALGWVTMVTPGQDTVTYRQPETFDFAAEWQIAGLPSHQYNIRFLAMDVCDNVDWINTPVVTVRMECDTTAPMAIICFPTEDMCVTNLRENCSELGEQYVPVQSTAPLMSDVDSVAYFFVDSLSVPGLGIHTFIGGTSTADSVVSEWAYYHSTGWNTSHLITGYYWLYAVAYDDVALFDQDPIWVRVWVDNTMPTVTECWVGGYGDDFEVIGTVLEGGGFYLRAFAEDNVGLDQSCGITGVQFQFLNRYGNWENLVDTDNWNSFYGADVYVWPSDGFATSPDAAGFYEINVNVDNFGNSPLDSIRFRAYAVDDVDWGNNNVQGDYNRDCNLDRDLECGPEICCMALEIRDYLPYNTDINCYNHAWFQWGLPQFTAPTTPIYDWDKYSTCNYQNPLDTLLLVAQIPEYIEDEWLMYFKFWRADGSTDTFDVPNDYSMNPALPRNADSAVVLESTWDSLYVVWPGARAWLDSADAADGLVSSMWCFSAYVEDLTGNVEEFGMYFDNTCCFYLECGPYAPITAVSYVTNDVQNPENRVRVTEDVAYTDFVTDTIEVIYNRTTDPGSNDPEALVIFYTDAEAIQNCRNEQIYPFNIRLYELSDDSTLGSLCWDRNTLTYGPEESFAWIGTGLGWDQYWPDPQNADQYEVGLYLDNSYPPGVYNFAMIVNWYSDASGDLLNEGDADCDGTLEEADSTRIDLVVRVVNVNEPQVVYCYPPYADVCGAHNTVPLSANDVSDPNYFSGEIDTVWFQRWDGDSWEPVVDAYLGVSYDTDPDYNYVRFEFDEKELPGMAGWYYERHDDPEYSWYAERDLFPDMWVYIWNTDDYHPMYDNGSGFWTADVYLETGDPYNCYDYSFVIDANDNNIFEGPTVDRWIDDPRNLDWENQDPVAYDRCAEDQIGDTGDGEAAYSTLCVCEYMVNFNSNTVGDGHHEFRTVVGWHDDIAYHVIENPAPGDSLHVFFVDNDAPVADHDIEYDRFILNGGRCTDPTSAWFVTDIQPIDGDYNLVVEDICAVIYQVSLTSDPQMDSSWMNVDTVYSNDDMGWIEAWSSYWTAYNPITDNIDNDGDGLVDETYDVNAGDGQGEENTWFWSRSVVTDHCGNTYCTEPESILVDVSEPRACISLVEDVVPGVNGGDVIVIPADRIVTIEATNQDYGNFDESILGVFQYRTLNPIGPWTNIQPADGSNDTTRHIGSTISADWDLLAYFDETGNDPENWYQLRVIAIDTVNNTDLCDNDVCYITIRLNDTQPAARVELWRVVNDSAEVGASCTVDESIYIHAADPYYLQAIFAPTNIDTGLASLTFQYAEVNGGVPSAWRNIVTIWDEIDNGLDGDTTAFGDVVFHPQPEDIGDQEIFWLRVIVEDYNGNDTSDVKVLYVDAIPPTGDGVAQGTLPVETACGDRCRFDIEPGSALVWMTFDPDMLSGEFNENEVWMTAVREDGNYYYNFGGMTRSDDDEWYFDFGGDLCDYWLDHLGQSGLDYGCYTFTVHFNDCQGNEDSVVVNTTCDGAETSLVCIDCYPDRPDHTDITSLNYSGWDCVTEYHESLTDEILDGSTEIGGDQSVSICGTLPDYEQDIWYVVLYVESDDAGVPATAVDTVWWNPTYNTHNNPNWCTYWWLADTTDEGAAKYPSGYYRVWALAHDAICQIQDAGMAEEFWVHVDHAAPVADIIEVNGEPVSEESTWFEVNSGEEDPVTLWVEWTDGLTPDDSTQTHNIVEVWCKNIWFPNQSDAWTYCGYIPSPCNPHYVELDLSNVHCGDSINVVAIASDRWGNGDHDVERAMEAYDEGHFINLHIFDTTPPSTMLWSVGLYETPCGITRDQGVDGLWIIDQQTHSVSLDALGETHDIYLHAFSMIGDQWPGQATDIERVYFDYSFDGTTWYEIGVDEEDEQPCEWNGAEPAPWWNGVDHDLLWTQIWDVSGMAGTVWVRVRGEDECGNIEEWDTYSIAFDVMAPMAEVFVWENGTHIDNLENCDSWTEEQVGDSVERYSWLTLGACADEEEADAYGAIWYIKRADDHPLEMWSWCNIGDDSTAPFSQDYTNLWGGTDCPQPQPGLWYDIAVLTTDQAGNRLTWTQFLNHGAGTTWEEKWASLIEQGYVKRFKAVDHSAPQADNLITDTDCTPDSSVIFLHGNVELTANVSMPDVIAVTFAFLEAGSEGPWTVIERVEGETGLFGPVEGYWNTELLNGTYWVGAFAEDNFGNMDGNLAGGAEGAPEHATLQVNIDNEAPTATISSVFVTSDPNQTPVTELERGAEHTFVATVSDNFGVSLVEFYYRHTGDPSSWTSFGADNNWPYSVNWTVPTDLVVGWTYEFAAVGWDHCNQTEFSFDWSAAVVDEEANISIYAINDYYDVEGTPHVNGTQICIYAESEPNLDYVRFIYVSAEGDTTEIHTTQGPVGQTDWSSCGNYWDVTTLPEGPAQICAIGSADLGGELVTMATDCRNIIIDHSLPYSQDGELPSSHGLLGGYCSLVSVPENEPDDIWVHFNNQLTDAGLDTVWFEWKWAESPNDPEFWYNVGYAYQDNGLTGNWVYSWDVYTYFTTDWDGCGTISLRAVLSDNAIPTSNLAYVLFADTVRVDNCPPDVQFTNVNGDLTPEGTVVPWGEIINIVATAEDVFGMGGNSNIDSVCFYGDDNDASDLIWCDTEGPLWSTQLATSSIPPNSTYNLRVIAWDEAGNCNEHTISIYVEDSQYQRACIVGFDDDNEFGCDDYIYAVTDDCDPNWTSAVNFQISTDLGQTWIPLDDWDESPEPQCNDWLGWNLWRVTLEFDLYPANAWFRAVARDESNNVDPNPPVWRRNDVTTTEETQIWVADWVRVPSNGQEQPWVLTTLEDYTENCLIEAGLVCIEPEAGSTYYAGEMPSNTRACELEDEDGRITVFTSNKVTEGDLTFVEMVTYSVDIHEANYQGGSNGTLVSEDGALEVTIPTWGTGWRGSLWFQPYLPSQAHDMVPAYQYYYTLISAVEEVQSDDLEELDIVTPECSFRIHFDNSLLPENAEEWQVVVAYWNWDMSDYSGMYEGGWQEFGITYNDRDLENGTVDFQWMPDWDISDVTSVCPDRVRFGVFLTTIRPIDEFVRINSGSDCNPWFENPVYNGLPVVDCTPNWWVVLGEGEFPPEPERVDVWLDGIRIVNDGEPVMLEGYDSYDDCDYYNYYDEIFSIEYDDISGIFSVEMTSNYGNCPPWYGCLMHGIHTIQFYVDDRPTNVTEFFVDNTDPMAHSEPGWVNQQVTLWADLEDRESGIDTGFVELDLKNCLDLTGILEYNLSSEAMTFTPLMDGDQQIGVHAEVTVQFDDIRFLFDVDTIIQGEFEICLNQLCAEWNVYNNTCLANHESHYYTYTVDEQPPVTYIISPRGAGIDDDGDGSVNEDPRDGINNDNDRFWGNGGWEARIDEDPVNFLADTFNCGERPVISSHIDDIERWCSGASGLDLSTWHILIDEHEYTAADTNNAALAMSFTTGPTNLTFVMGGDGAGEVADAWYEPGEHVIQVWVSDLVGNQGSNGNDPDFAWTYYVECPGPAVEFHDTEAGNWFNPEFQPGHPREFGFTVTTTSGAAIAPNGITYTAVTVPDNFPLAATTVDPAGQDEVEVTFTLDGSFPDGQTGINITVETRNIFAVAGDDNGTNTSSRTYWADGCEPMEVTHIPATDAEVGNEGNVVVEVQYNDDCGSALFNVGGNVALTKSTDGALSVNNSKNALTKNSITSRNGDGALDDNGSGINTDRVWFVVVPPRGDVMRFEELEDFIELTSSSAKILLTNPIAGLWTVNAYAEDRVANLATWTWTFRVLSTGPVIDLSYSTEGTCQYNGFWNPNYPLWFEGTVTENDGANVRNGDISVHFYGLYDCDGQICEQELTGNLTLDISPAYDNSNVEQTFTLGGQATFGDFDGYGTPTDLRVELTACDQFGVCQTIEQTYVVDATAPNIEIISPLANSVLSDVNLVTISAHIWDDEDGGAFTMPGGNETLMDKNAAQVTGVFGGTNLKGTKSADTYNVTKFELGSWKDALTRSFNNSLDGNSGVDPECVELRLINHTTGTSTNLTEEASFNAGILSWTGALECASYTVVVSACDHTCNTSSEVWSFVVSCETPGDGIEFLPPWHVSAMPHCFKALVTDDMIDRGTMRLNLEGGMMVDGNLVWAPIVVDAPVNFNGDTAIYCANFDLSGLANIRASLGGYYNGGIAFPSVIKVYTVDTGAPVFTAIQPDPSVVLGILTDPEFRVDFAEVGTTGLDPASVRFWLTTAGGTTVADEPTVSIAPNGLTGYATLRPEPLASGDYVLHADLSDIAGNHASMTWAYQVGADLPIPTDVIHNFPNPFTKEDGHTTFVLFAPGSGAGADVEIKIYDVAGHFVKTVIDGIVADPGLPITWDGTNENDEEVANGVYLAYVNINGGGGESKQSIVKVAYKKEAK